MVPPITEKKLRQLLSDKLRVVIENKDMFSSVGFVGFVGFEEEIIKTEERRETICMPRK